MSKILLTSGPVRVIKVLKPTKARLFKDLGEGSLIEFSVDLKPPGTGRSGYAKSVTVRNIATDEKERYTFNELSILGNFQLEELEAAYEKGRQDGPIGEEY